MAKNKPKRTLWYYLREAAIMYLMVAAGMYLLQSFMLFHPDKKVRYTPANHHWEFESIVLDVNGEKTDGWYIPLENARGVLLFSHGNEGNIAEWLPFVHTFRKLGFSVLLYDYGGFGRSTGRPSEERCYADGRAMWNWLTKVKGIPPEKILLYGQSLGGGVTANLAVEVTPRAVVLDSTFTSIPDVGARMLPFLPVRLLCSYRFDNASKVPNIHVPVMVIHSPRDQLTPYSHGQKLFELANEPKTFLEIHGRHVMGFTDSEAIVSKGLEKFLAPLFPTPVTPSPIP